MESEQLEDALSVLDRFRDGGAEDDYAEVVDLCTEVKDIGNQNLILKMLTSKFF